MLSNPALQKAETEWKKPCQSASHSRISVDTRNAAVSRIMPANSATNVMSSTRRTSRTIPPGPSWLNEAWITSRSFRVILRWSASMPTVITVMYPSPPNWIRIRITILPNTVQLSMVLSTTRPVTQFADVAVNSASRKPTLSPLRLAKGRASRTAPMRIIRAKPATIDCAGVRWIFAISRRYFCIFEGFAFCSIAFSCASFLLYSCFCLCIVARTL